MSSSLMQVVPYCDYENRYQPMMIIFNIIVISLNRLTSTLGLKEVNYVLLEQMFLRSYKKDIV